MRYFWPVALVIVGLLIVSGDWRRRRPRGGSGGGSFSRHHGPGGPFAGGPGAAGWPLGGASGPHVGAGGDPDVVEGKVVDENEPAARASNGRD